MKTCDDVRKVASTSDFAKIFESHLRVWVTEDIGNKLDKNQFAGKKGTHLKSSNYKCANVIKLSMFLQHCEIKEIQIFSICKDVKQISSE